MRYLALTQILISTSGVVLLCWPAQKSWNLSYMDQIRPSFCVPFVVYEAKRFIRFPKLYCIVLYTAMKTIEYRFKQCVTRLGY